MNHTTDPFDHSAPYLAPDALYPAVQVASDAWRAAAEALAAATRETFPIGCKVTVKLGKHSVTGIVLQSGGNYWYQPSSVTIRNIATGKLRHFEARSTSCQARVIQPPEAHAQ